MKILALVTLYYPDCTNASNIRRLRDQVDNVILLDNTPKIDNGHLFEGVDVEYIANLENLGLSLAFNKGLKYINAEPDFYVIFFDQDSSINDGHINQLIADYEYLSNDHRVGCIGPAYYNHNTGEIVENGDKVHIKNGLYSVKSLITSSLLTRYQVLDDIGFWNEDVFLDYADWDLCWRMKEKKYVLVLDSNVTLNHSLGDSAVSVGAFSFPKYSAVREYYRIRDSLKIIMAPYVPFKYRLKFTYTWLIEPFIYLILFPERISRLMFVGRAFRDAFRKVNGPFKSKAGN